MQMRSFTLWPFLAGPLHYPLPVIFFKVLPLLHSFLWMTVFEGFRFSYTLCTKTDMIMSLGRQPWIIHSGSLSQTYWSLSLWRSDGNSNGTFQPVFPDQIGPWWLEQTWQEPKPWLNPRVTTVEFLVTHLAFRQLTRKQRYSTACVYLRFCPEIHGGAFELLLLSGCFDSCHGEHSCVNVYRHRVLAALRQIPAGRVGAKPRFTIALFYCIPEWMNPSQV